MRKIFLTASFLVAFFFFFAKATAAYNAPDFHNSSIVATTSDSDRAPADGKTDAVVTVTVKDAYGTPLAGEIVSLVVTDDTSASVAPSSNNLDSAGKAIFYIRSTKEGVDSLDIVDKTQNVTLPGIGHVTFYSTTCTDAAPAGPPKLLSTTAISGSQIKITWTKAADPVTFYTLYYGTKKGVYVYGNPNVGGANTTSYTVGGLSSGVTYYFIVIPGNGCTLGPASNELLAKAAAPTNTPAPTENVTVSPSTTPSASFDKTSVITKTPTPSSGTQKKGSFNQTAIMAIAAGILLLASVAFFVRSQR